MDLEKEIEQIKQRNKKVELDKAWETSWTRRICIMILTYIVVIIYSHLIQNTNNIALSSLVPVIGFTECRCKAPCFSYGDIKRPLFC